MHGDRFTQDIVDQTIPTRMSHRCNATFGESQVDRLGKVQWYGRRVPEIYGCAGIIRVSSEEFAMNHN